MSEPDLSEWNQRTVELVQASLGEIRPEIRMISLSRRGDLWFVAVSVEKLDDHLREDIMEDIVTEFEAFMGGPWVDAVIEVVKGKLSAPTPPGRVVYLRHEPGVH